MKKTRNVSSKPKNRPTKSEVKKSSHHATASSKVDPASFVNTTAASTTVTSASVIVTATKTKPNKTTESIAPIPETEPQPAAVEQIPIKKVLLQASQSQVVTPYSISPSMRKSEMHYLQPKILTHSDFLKRLALCQPGPVPTETPAAKRVENVVAETKEIEQRIKEKLDMLRLQARQAVMTFNQDRKEEDESSPKHPKITELDEKITLYEQKLEAVKATMEDILKVAQQTQQEVMNTKEIVSGSSLNPPPPVEPSKIIGSFHEFESEDAVDNFMRDVETEQNMSKPLDADKVKRAAAAAAMDQELIQEEAEGKTARIREMAVKIREYEQKVLESESERIKREKENLDLRESILELKRQLQEKEMELLSNRRMGQSPVSIFCWSPGGGSGERGSYTNTPKK